LTGITVDTDPSVLFSGNNSCILTPETTEGPYWVEGEVVRSNVTEDQEGVPLHLDIQLIDVNTCEPVPQAYLEIWHCNATGVYGGVVNDGNGNTNDLTNIDKTFLRGIQESDESGVVEFDTIFPGHYVGRTVSVSPICLLSLAKFGLQTHIHVLTHTGASLLANNTLSGGNFTHVGQIFADQDLISLVEATAPYNTNTQELTTNAEDGILAGEAADVDPMIEYVLVGDEIEQGLFGWIAFGFDNTASYNVTPAVYWTSDGGVKNPDGMGGGPPPSGSAPGVIASTLSTVGSSASAPA
jgi:protocatechuate 3,4-dioxygenase beta subunit